MGSAVSEYLKRLGRAHVCGYRQLGDLEEGEKGLSLKRVFDFTDPSTYAGALEGVRQLLLIRPPSLTDVKAVFSPFLSYCEKQGVERVVFISLMGAEKNPFPPHYRIEKRLLSSSMSYTFIRPSFFMQNLLDPHGEDVRLRDEIFIPAGSARLSFIDTDDIGEMVARLLAREEGYDRAYTVTGPQALSYEELAQMMSEVLGRSITYARPGLLSFRRRMISRGVDPAYASVMVALYLSTRLGMAKRVTEDAELLLGRPPRSLFSFIEAHKEAWRGPGL